MKILIVDDHTTLQYVKEALPADWHNEGVIVNSPKQADRFVTSSPRMAVLNCSDPEHEIVGLCNEFRNRFNNFNYAVLLSDEGLTHPSFSGKSSADEEPFSQKELISAIINGVEKRKPVLANNVPAERQEPLTRRQLQVLKLMEHGFSNEEIASAFGITVGTVKSHINQIFEKLSVKSRSKAVLKAIRLGLI